MPTVSAVVVTCNRWSCLQQCLESLKNQTVSLSNVVVLDNASADGTREAVAEHFPWVTYIRMEENIGGAGGFSEGIRIAYEKGYDWLWIMDDDAVPRLDALEGLLETEVIQRPETGVLACLVVGVDGELDLRSGARWLNMRNFRTVSIFDGQVPQEEVIECNSATFVGILVCRSAIAQVGFPRSDFFIACDDVEYIYRICKAGFKVYQVPKSQIIHLSAGKSVHKRAGSRFLLNRGTPPPLWRCYYNWRNSMYLIHQHSTRATFVKKAVRFATGAILFGDQKLRRLHLLAEAIGDARAGRLGRRAFRVE